MHGFSLTYHRFGLFKREAFLRLQALGECVVLDSNEKSISDNLAETDSSCGIFKQIIKFNVHLLYLQAVNGFESPRN